MNESQADEIDKPVASSSEAAESLETDEDNGYHWLADDEIEYILDKLSPRDKARARLVCKTWCRVLSEPAFLLRDVNWMDFNNANLSQLRDCIMCLPVNGVYRLEHVRELVLTLPILHRESGKRQAYRMLCSALVGRLGEAFGKSEDSRKELLQFGAESDSYEIRVIAEEIRYSLGEFEYLSDVEDKQFAFQVVRRICDHSLTAYKTVEYLVLNPHSKSSQLGALEALATSKSREDAYASIIERVLDSSSPEVLCYGLDVLANIGCPTVGSTHLIAGLLSHSFSQVRGRACRCLRYMKSAALPYLELIATKANDRYPDVRSEAIRSLIEIGRLSFDAASAQSGESTKDKLSVNEASEPLQQLRLDLPQSSPSWLQSIVKATEDINTSVKMAALQGLGLLFSFITNVKIRRESVAATLLCLKHPDYQVRKEAIKALGLMSPSYQACMKAIELFSDRDLEVRREIFQFIRTKCTDGSTEVAEAITEKLGFPDQVVCRSVKMYFRDPGPVTHAYLVRLVTALVKRMSSSKEQTRKSSEAALNHLYNFRSEEVGMILDEGSRGQIGPSIFKSDFARALNSLGLRTQGNPNSC